MSGVKKPQIELVIEAPKIELSIAAPQVSLDVGKFGDVPIEYESYEGDYTVIPSRHEQTLATANKLLEQDIVIKEVPYSEVGNLAGGSTFYIAKEIDE